MSEDLNFILEVAVTFVVTIGVLLWIGAVGTAVYLRIRSKK